LRLMSLPWPPCFQKADAKKSCCHDGAITAGAETKAASDPTCECSEGSCCRRDRQIPHSKTIIR
jgi:hypothetical protein